MVRGADFDFYQPQAPKPAERAAPAGDRRTAPGPTIPECCECGRPACFGEGVSLLKGIEGDWYCPKHAPAEFRRPSP